MNFQVLVVVFSLQLITGNAMSSMGNSPCPFHRVSRALLGNGNESKCGVEVTSCPITNYRSFTGACNNLFYPSLGTPNNKYARLLPANYGDGISTPTLAKSGKPLPSARKVSSIIYPDINITDPLWTLNTMQYGQFISHDLSLLISRNVTCCSDGQVVSDPSEYCYEITVPSDDPAYAPYNISCLEFSRAITDIDEGCNGNSVVAEQLTSVNHYLDLSLVYGNSESANQELRSFSKGKLRNELSGDQEMLPSGNYSCSSQADGVCYLAGDTRVNQNPELTVLHTIYLREHNRVAEQLSKLNPHWQDERIFQEARKIVIAEHQQISYYEWLPIILGRDYAYDAKLVYNTTDFVSDYDPRVDISVYNEFSTGAFRFFHTMIAGMLDLVDESRKTVNSTRISNYWNSVVNLLERSFDDLSRGLVTQAELAADVYHDEEITLDWLRQRNATIGQDLKSICIQRNRDHGLASYNDHRELCGLPRAQVFDDFLDVMNQSNVDKLATLYEHPDDIELTVGDTMETILNQTLVGPTVQCILTKQFYKTRVGDRFWFENPGPTRFTVDQLNAIRKATISRLMCDNTEINQIQPEGFKIISDTNALEPCGDLPSVDLSLWKEKVPETSWIDLILCSVLGIKCHKF